MSLRRSTGKAGAPRAVLLLTGLLALLAFALPGAAPAQETQPESVLVCLADDDGSYVLLSVAPDRVAEYRRNTRNIVPAPVSGCPARVEDQTASSGSGSGGSGGSTSDPKPRPDDSGTADDSNSGTASAGDAGSGDDTPGSGKAGGSGSGGDGAGGGERSEPARLANTGSETWAILGGGVLMVGLGAGLSLRRRREA